MVTSAVDSEGYAEVVYADTPGRAKIWVRDTFRPFANTDFVDLRARRAPEFDAEISERAKLDNGWWAECAGCYTRVSRDRENDGEIGPIVFDANGCAYCSEACMAAAEAKAHSAAALEQEVGDAG